MTGPPSFPTRHISSVHCHLHGTTDPVGFRVSEGVPAPCRESQLWGGGGDFQQYKECWVNGNWATDQLQDNVKTTFLWLLGFPWSSSPLAMAWSSRVTLETGEAGLGMLSKKQGMIWFLFSGCKGQQPQDQNHYLWSEIMGQDRSVSRQSRPAELLFFDDFHGWTKTPSHRCDRHQMMLSSQN